MPSRKDKNCLPGNTKQEKLSKFRRSRHITILRIPHWLSCRNRHSFTAMLHRADFLLRFRNNLMDNQAKKIPIRIPQRTSVG